MGITRTVIMPCSIRRVRYGKSILFRIPGLGESTTEGCVNHSFQFLSKDFQAKNILNPVGKSSQTSDFGMGKLITFHLDTRKPSLALNIINH